jgi:hypothetical protein
MHPDRIATLTPHQDINQVLVALTSGIDDALGDQLVGLYLTGSLTYGDFDRGSSDIDYLAVMTREIDASQRTALEQLHMEIGERFPEWRERIEGSYVTVDMLPQVQPPTQGRPYVNQGAFWDPDPPYGNEWILNLYVLRECGIALVGPDPADLIAPVDIADVREASKRDLIDERVPTLVDPTMYDDPHQQAYSVLTLCRILHRQHNDGVASKRVASAWVKARYGEPWRSLVENAESWQHGESLATAGEVKDFIRFAARDIG